MIKPQSLQNQIRVKLFKIIGAYLVLTTALILALSITSILIYQHNQTVQYQTLVKTKIDADISAALREASALGTSPVIWTGLTDSEGRDTYLRPLLQRINATNKHKVDLLDYRGRDFIITESFPEKTRETLPVVRQVVETDQMQAAFLDEAQKRYLLIALPIVAPFADSALGVLLIRFDIQASIDALKLPPYLKININNPDYKPVSTFGDNNVTGDVRIQGGDHVIDLSVGVSKSILGGFVSVLIGFVIAALGGLFVFLSLKKWSYTFSQNTTSRLNDLVTAASKAAKGEDFVSETTDSQDEIDTILTSIQKIFALQKESNAKLLISSKVFETAGEAILITDTGGQILDVNQALLSLTGYSKEELIGKPAGILYRNNASEMTHERISVAIREQGSWKGEAYFIGAQSEEIPAMLSISTLIDGRGVNRGNVAIFSDIRPIKSAEEQLKKLIYEDQLTSLPNYRAFLEYVKQRLESDAQTPFILLFIDLDHFKSINDTYNHEQGDVAILQVSEYLKCNLPNPHLLFRRSGDEFIAIVEVRGDIEKTKVEIAAILHSVVIEIGANSKNTISSSFSSGGSIYPNNSKNIQDLLIYADTALQFSKENGRSRVTWFDDGVKQQIARRNAIETKLIIALREHRIIPYYQPEVDMRTGEVIGFEALARWHDEQFGFIPPDEFIPIAEQRGLIGQVTESMLTGILRDLNALTTQFKGAKVSFNSSPKLFKDRKIFKILADHLSDELDYSSLIMEITETELIQSADDAASQLDCIIGLGIKIAIDDFGKGYSSLSRLGNMPIHKLKIDCAFIAAHHETGNKKIIESIISLSKALNLDISAEGVESVEQKKMLIELGCYKAQGFLFAKALPIDAILQGDFSSAMRHHVLEES